MGTNTGGNGSQAGAGGIQLPAVAWEIEDGPAAAAAGPEADAPSYGQVEPAAAQAPAAPKYGPVLPDPDAAHRRPAAAE
ncbi:hypothetical protein KSNIM_30985, partial [Kitasatospora sp. DSM 101779]|nr:hypothetical protein [Kitasatospora sp. DSM 101779]